MPPARFAPPFGSSCLAVLKYDGFRALPHLQADTGGESGAALRSPCLDRSAHSATTPRAFISNWVLSQRLAEALVPRSLFQLFESEMIILKLSNAARFQPISSRAQKRMCRRGEWQRQIRESNRFTFSLVQFSSVYEGSFQVQLSPVQSK